MGQETTSQSETFSSAATMGVPRFLKCLPVMVMAHWKVLRRLWICTQDPKQVILY